jgi:hypothetical protein
LRDPFKRLLNAESRKRIYWKLTIADLNRISDTAKNTIVMARSAASCGHLRRTPDMQLFGAALLSSILCGSQGSVGYGANGIAEVDPFLTTELQDFIRDSIHYR